VQEVKDRVHLAKYDWGQVIVDEGRCLKNMNSILMQEMKSTLAQGGRMLLTGTPLHVGVVRFLLYVCHLAELWSLLDFILPEVFGVVAAFRES